MAKLHGILHVTMVYNQQMSAPGLCNEVHTLILTKNEFLRNKEVSSDKPGKRMVDLTVL